MITNAFDAFCTKFKLSSLTVRRYQHWTWSVRPVQSTLGASIISLNRPAVAWGEVTTDENAELALVVKDIEEKTRALFSYNKINYLMLMMVDDHVHFHVFPRYSEARNYLGKTWLDSLWPKPPDLLNGDSEEAALLQLRDALK